VSHVSFAVLVIVYSYLNIVIHCGLHLRSFWLRPFGFMARKHDRHHQHMKAGNFASITPIPDLLFGTYE
jgi:sterol desaturase/sphingolipid hydroxylase (fatty acid hydroxylase superfamily)